MKLATNFVWHIEVDTMCEDIGSHADAHHKTSMMKVALDNKEDKITWPIAASKTSYAIWGLA